ILQFHTRHEAEISKIPATQTRQEAGGMPSGRRHIIPMRFDADRGRDDGRSPYSSNALVQLVRTHDTATRRSCPFSVPPVRRRHDLALRKVPWIRPTLQVSKVRLYGTIDDDDASTGHDQDIPLRCSRGHGGFEGEDSKILGWKGLNIQV